ncbi:DUF4871 domain-containing protein [Solibacillus sp. FSL K6-1523]|uniref:DUF4871 domain-containing protein n=1 Tax=Solibacillus sp. FSL K6-1523 TaxID=2921471 RepID=UPI0030FA638A
MRMYFLKRISKLFIVLSMLFLTVGCTTNETIRDKLILPENLPDFVEVSDLESVDWAKKAVTFNNNILGNENKSGVIGADMPSININQKWMWHLWGIENPADTKLTVVGLHRETGTAHPILADGWTIVLSGANNGADAHAPSAVNIPEAGQWAVLLYTDGEFFDQLVLDIKE